MRFSLIGPGLVKGLNIQYLPLIFNPGSKGARKCCPTPHSVWWQKSGATWAFFSATPYLIWLTASTSSSKLKAHDIIPKEWLTLGKCFDNCQNKFKYLGVWFDKMAEHQISGSSDEVLIFCTPTKCHCHVSSYFAKGYIGTLLLITLQKRYQIERWHQFNSRKKGGSTLVFVCIDLERTDIWAPPWLGPPSYLTLFKQPRIKDLIIVLWANISSKWSFWFNWSK